MYSAIKIRGKKLYEIARRGGDVEREPRPITIYRLEVTDQDENGDWGLEIECSKGTYIRTLCADIGEALGCGGCMSALRRTRAGDFTIAEAHTLEEIRANPDGYILPLERITGRIADNG
jgi:tRNA pseudouridine55 synthase